MDATTVFTAIVGSFLLLIFTAYIFSVIAGTKKMRVNQKIMIELLVQIAKKNGTTDQDIQELYDRVSEMTPKI